MTIEVKDPSGLVIGSASLLDEPEDLRTPEQKERDALREFKRHNPGGPKPTPKVPALRIRKRRAAKQTRKHNR